MLRDVLYFISLKEDVLTQQTNIHPGNTPLRKKDVLCVYIKSIYNKRRGEKERRQHENG
jgi:hypothetical protein